MAYMCCPECGKKFALRDDMAGKKVKCQCGARFRVPGPTAAAPKLPWVLPVTTDASIRVRLLPCPHCQQEVQPNWKACPACGQRLPVTAPPLAVKQPGSPQPDPPAIRTGDNSVVKAVVNQRTNTEVAADLPWWIPASPAQPLISTGSESVVKAEINTSHTVSAAGDIVHHKEVHATHHETHIHQKESAVRAITDVFQGIGAKPGNSKQCIEMLTHAIHSGIGAMPFVLLFLFWPIGIYLILSAGKRKEATVKALLARLRGWVREEPALQHEYRRLATEWEVAQRSLKTKAKLTACVVIGCFALLVGLPLLTLPSTLQRIEGERQADTTVRQDVQKLIQEGRYDEARIRAQSLRYSWDVEKLTQAIDKAEKSRQPPPQGRDDTP